LKTSKNDPKNTLLRFSTDFSTPKTRFFTKKPQK
jgi:hypothetical protein